MSQFGGIPQTKFQNGAVLMTRASFQQKWGLGSPRRNALKPSRMEIRTVHRIRSSLVCPGRRQELWGRSYSRFEGLQILTSKKKNLGRQNSKITSKDRDSSLAA